MAKFAIEWGVPEMDELWTGLSGKADTDTLDGDELRLFKKLVKTMTLPRGESGASGSGLA